MARRQVEHLYGDLRGNRHVLQTREIAGGMSLQATEMPDAWEDWQEDAIAEDGDIMCRETETEASEQLCGSGNVAGLGDQHCVDDEEDEDEYGDDRIRPLVIVNWSRALQTFPEYLKYKDVPVNETDKWKLIAESITTTVLTPSNFDSSCDMLFESQAAFHTTSIACEVDLLRLQNRFPDCYFSAISYPPLANARDAAVLWDEATRAPTLQSDALLELKSLILSCSRPLSWKALMCVEIENLAIRQQLLAMACDMTLRNNIETPTTDALLEAAQIQDDAEDEFDPQTPVEQMNILDQILAMCLSRMPMLQESAEQHFQSMAERHNLLRSMWIRDFGTLPRPLPTEQGAMNSVDHEDMYGNDSDGASGGYDAQDMERIGSCTGGVRMQFDGDYGSMPLTATSVVRPSNGSDAMRQQLVGIDPTTAMQAMQGSEPQLAFGAPFGFAKSLDSEEEQDALLLSAFASAFRAPLQQHLGYSEDDGDADAYCGDGSVGDSVADGSDNDRTSQKTAIQQLRRTLPAPSQNDAYDGDAEDEDSGDDDAARDKVNDSVVHEQMASNMLTALRLDVEHANDMVLEPEIDISALSLDMGDDDADYSE
eukprot:m.189985 g.189985  ORF g.189985 m.189985 type:complete len:596 (-) comp14805_c0_seq1:198-1985(-)